MKIEDANKISDTVVAFLKEERIRQGKNSVLTDT